ncbi:2-succinyl-5-enolpyruvyl-6-hydroxy-3-cyclohexene-1-carboxylic-acid synthase [Mechercharimyces sp. CAU 1602]|uniref:2-succinyl-5-enolpyruvyl-6-hydroxy-3- cyclohexene-1-carboxylic-acid synthase n=1 Tax=Mechercharimyces sp. CAU 1602 TaxID=2973933 RepID=UPI00216210C2|nr:2-succinyl-5-enolpyruvyl-6-hydroxy-3-cyclohexene-1-carboxylic-acid synthase [Mechercharimyces sp. CAU 1602]MCS1351578.1 2-succinyl-5-enolpyruvyl-6-hydroxy-3-cyclohexene-1-carboxylic-acid synthase [Mechercharimyces sp. CAU 1602]
MNHQDELTYYLAAFVDEWARLGLKHVVVSPGSRSTPLAMLFAAHPQIQIWMHVDERSAAFFALGMAKAEKRPVGLLCTSGTAAANYYPAIAEAWHSRIPLLVLTADRPHELREVGAPQTMRQQGLYGSFVKWYQEVALPEASPTMKRYARTVAARSFSSATVTPQAPVHLNFPLREPLIPRLDAPELWREGRSEGNPYVTVTAGSKHMELVQMEPLLKRLREIERGLIICGPQEDRELAQTLVHLAEYLRYPLLADPLSQVRRGGMTSEWIIDSYDAFLRHGLKDKRLSPQLVLRFGAMPVSKPLLQFLQVHPQVETWMVDDGNGWRDPTLLVQEVIWTDPVSFCGQLVSQLTTQPAIRANEEWEMEWGRRNRDARMVVSDFGGSNHHFEGKIMHEVIEALPPDATLFVGNSMPIRDLDTFLHSGGSPIQVMANRGVNGIDGLVSTALGVSALREEAVVLVVGDLSFYHDLNGLIAAKLYPLSLTIVVVNNDGGGIFSFLPQAKQEAHFETLFGTPLGLDYEAVVRMYEGTFQRVVEGEALTPRVQTAIQTGGLNVIEVRTERTFNANIHRQMWEAVEQACQYEGRG